MRRPWVRAPLALLALAACGTGIDPALRYRQAAQSLRYTLDRVQPTLEMRFPLDRSVLKVHLVLGVDNPSSLRFHLQAASGVLWLEKEGRRHRIGEVATRGAIWLEPVGHGAAGLDLAFAYQDLRAAWEPLSDTLLGSGKGTWHLEGKATVEVLGLPLTLPFATSREQGK
jgi:hypothetical protein